MIFNKADILLPKLNDYSKWAVVACDQFTSQPEYWAEVRKIVDDKMSSLHLILPEAELSANNDIRINNINKEMKLYLKKDLFDIYENSYVYVERKLENGKVRKGIIGTIDLEEYDYSSKSISGIRATEQTVMDRIPPRVKIRENALIELPHVLLLMDDQKHQVLESIEMIKDTLPVLYDFDLMQGGGHIKGWLISADKVNIFEEALNIYLQETREKYQKMNKNPMFFAVGDGNHSLAAAKECYERQKVKLGSNIKSRYALVELENLQDDTQKFEPIHRLLKEVNTEDVLKQIKEKICVKNSKNKIEYYTKNEHGILYLDENLGKLSVGILQKFLDNYIRENDCFLDYIHDDEVLKKLSNTSNTIGFLLSAIDKESLFPGIVNDGVLPRKTFSMGHAQEKRYYIEARKIM